MLGGVRGRELITPSYSIIILVLPAFGAGRIAAILIFVVATGAYFDHFVIAHSI